MFSDITRVEYNDALEQTAEQLMWEANVQPGAVDAFELADRLEVAVLRDFIYPGKPLGRPSALPNDHALAGTSVRARFRRWVGGSFVAPQGRSPKLDSRPRRC